MVTNAVGVYIWKGKGVHIMDPVGKLVKFVSPTVLLLMKCHANEFFLFLLKPTRDVLTHIKMTRNCGTESNVHVNCIFFNKIVVSISRIQYSRKQDKNRI